MSPVEYVLQPSFNSFIINHNFGICYCTQTFENLEMRNGAFLNKEKQN